MNFKISRRNKLIKICNLSQLIYKTYIEIEQKKKSMKPNTDSLRKHS